MRSVKRATLPQFRAGLVLLASVGVVLGGCAQTSNPDPSPSFDGRYVGTRESNLTEACGITTASGRTQADVVGGKLTMLLFNPGTKMTGTVGEDGKLRASGLWQSPHGFHNFTLMQGEIVGGLLSGIASDSRCVTDVELKRVRRR